MKVMADELSQANRTLLLKGETGVPPRCKKTLYVSIRGAFQVNNGGITSAPQVKTEYGFWAGSRPGPSICKLFVN